MIPSFEKLTKLEPPPPNPLARGTPERWKQVENRLGFRLPNDYKLLTDLYGVGHWVNFVEIMNPVSLLATRAGAGFFCLGPEAARGFGRWAALSARVFSPVCQPSCSQRAFPVCI